MRYGALVFLAAFVAMAASWAGFVVTPQLQLGRDLQTNAIASSELYPQARPGQAKQGAEVYRANGCMYCHSQQVGQAGSIREVVLTDAGTNLEAVIAALQQLDGNLNAVAARDQLARLPKTLQTNATPLAANTVTKMFEPTGAKVEMRILASGPDISRGWGQRRSVSRDYLFDQPVQPGLRRIGPDLVNVGLRLPDLNWHLLHLYAPQSNVKGSTMPPYRFLFETRKIVRTPSPDALALPAELAPPAGCEVVPTAQARELAAYLLSRRAAAPLFEAPITPPPAPAAPATNAPTATASTK
jgi:cbb3-type cytochrome oxidase cytochrome c subunit